MTEEFSSINPATGDPVWTGRAASPSEIEAAVAAARRAFESWSNTSMDHRIHVLQSFTEQLKQRKPELTEAISRETGKPKWESAAEVDTMIADQTGTR